MAGTPTDSPSPFADYHRARRRSAIGALAAVGITVALVITSGWAMGSATSVRAEAATTPLPAASASASQSPVPPTPTGARARALPAMKTAPAVSAPAPRTGLGSVVRITVTATGYQRELDECQWVLMELGAEAPIVGAHTQCGGSVVLAMRQGDVVDLTGEGTAGSYIVTDIRAAHSGQDAAQATAGMKAELILQTCYPGTGGRERLVGLEPR